MNLQRYKEYKANIKRTADFLEKIAAFSFGVAAFQDNRAELFSAQCFSLRHKYLRHGRRNYELLVLRLHNGRRCCGIWLSHGVPCLQGKE